MKPNGQPNLTSTLSALGNGVLAISAFLIAVTFVVKEFRPKADTNRISERPVRVWSELLAASSVVRVGSGLVDIVEIGDFQCPACRAFAAVLTNLEQRYPQNLSIRFIHFPQPYHAYANEASLAALCAAEQDAFRGNTVQLR